MTICYMCDQSKSQCRKFGENKHPVCDSCVKECKNKTTAELPFGYCGHCSRLILNWTDGNNCRTCRRAIEDAQRQKAEEELCAKICKVLSLMSM